MINLIARVILFVLDKVIWYGIPDEMRREIEREDEFAQVHRDTQTPLAGLK